LHVTEVQIVFRPAEQWPWHQWGCHPPYCYWYWCCSWHRS